VRVGESDRGKGALNSQSFLSKISLVDVSPRLYRTLYVYFLSPSLKPDHSLPELYVTLHRETKSRDCQLLAHCCRVQSASEPQHAMHFSQCLIRWDRPRQKSSLTLPLLSDLLRGNHLHWAPLWWTCMAMSSSWSLHPSHWWQMWWCIGKKSSRWGQMTASMSM
jgi:hypothetical protein